MPYNAALDRIESLVEVVRELRCALVEAEAELTLHMDNAGGTNEDLNRLAHIRLALDNSSTVL